MFYYYQHHATNDIDLMFSILVSHMSSLALLKAYTRQSTSIFISVVVSPHLPAGDRRQV